MERDERRRKLAAVSNALVHLHARHYGKAPTRARAHLNDDFALVLLHEPFTAVETTFIAGGHADHVVENRLRVYKLLEGEFRSAVAELVGREVVAFMPQISLDPPVVSALFLLRPTDEKR